MHRFNFKKGLVFTEIDNRWQLHRRLVSGNLQFENEQGQIKTLTDGELNRLYLRGEWTVDINTIGSAKDVIHLATPSDLSAFPEKWQKRARRRLHYIQEIKPEKNRYNIELWKRLISVAATKINDPKPPIPMTVQNWWRRYRTTKSITKLIPVGLHGRERARDARYPIFEDVVSKIYLSPQKRQKWTSPISVLSALPYRDNYLPKRELAGAVMQAEKYIFHLNKWGVEGENFIQKKRGNELPRNLKVQITNPKALIIIGRDNNFTNEHKLDFEIIRRKYANMMDILTYDDLLRRLDNIIARLGYTNSLKK